MVTVTVWGREFDHRSSASLRYDVQVLDSLLQKIKEPVITGNSHPFEYFYTKPFDSNQLSDIMMMWLNQQICPNESLDEYFIRTGTEDEAWAIENSYDAYTKKITLSPETQKLLEDSILENKSALSQCLKKVEEEETAQKREREELKSRWSLAETIKEIYPTAGKDGEYSKDGYVDAVYIHNITGKTLRFVSRDVFDVGVYNHPKRLEGSDDIFSVYSDEENDLCKWLAVFGPFTHSKILERFQKQKGGAQKVVTR